MSEFEFYLVLFSISGEHVARHVAATDRTVPPLFVSPKVKRKERKKINQYFQKKKKKKLAWTAHGERVTTDGLIGTDRTCRGITVSSERSCSDSGRCRCADVTDRCLATVMLPVSSLPCPGKHGGERGGVGLFVDSLQFISLSTQTRIPNWP